MHILESVERHVVALREELSGIELRLEPGRFLVSEAGVLVLPVTQVRSKDGINFVGVATGWNEAAPCNIALNRQAQSVKLGVKHANGTPREFTTIEPAARFSISPLSVAPMRCGARGSASVLRLTSSSPLLPSRAVTCGLAATSRLKLTRTSSPWVATGRSRRMAAMARRRSICCSALAGMTDSGE